MEKMTEVVATKSQEEYEDDFEKDLDWLISEEGRSEEQGCEYDAKKDKEEEEHVKAVIAKINENGSQKPGHVEEDEERWPSPMEPLEYDIDQEGPSKSSPLEAEEQSDEEKKYMLEKIQQANKELQEQETPDVTRRRRLHFKETLVDLVVPPIDLQAECNSTENNEKNSSKGETTVPGADTEVSGKMSELKLSPRNESIRLKGSNDEDLEQSKEIKVLVEKNGKFDFVSMKDVECQSVLPPITNNVGNSTQSSPGIHQRVGKTYSSFSPQHRIGSSSFNFGINPLQAPRPPTQPKIRPSSASHSQRGTQSKNSKRRVQSAAGTPSQATYTLSPQQKELLQRIQEKKERLAREAEQRKHEEEELKRQENEQAFKAWLMRKREQLNEERRIQRAKEIEMIKRDSCDPEEAFRSWLQRKKEQQQRERQLVELRKLEEDSSYLLHSREECERAFKLWLKRKHAEKRAEQQAVREHSRRLVMEERRARHMRDLMCPVSETRPFRFMEQLTSLMKKEGFHL
ncbi:coiled-coil domain-containing protein 181 [Cyprinodon tularosa]|uniref:coiled-coil domain-containing protein 181 n=1 Tax=Cyprinodon tularosa TaxID=77115 RepID=UPI0018E221C9|nr:coiled-coil domain-containing protein 181 [Cyprinodon tularosa]